MLKARIPAGIMIFMKTRAGPGMDAVSPRHEAQQASPGRPESRDAKLRGGASLGASRLRAGRSRQVFSRRVSPLLSVVLALLILPVHCHPAEAASAAVGPVSLSVPEGFVAAPMQRQENMSVWAWTKSARGGRVKALLQVSVYDYGSQLARSSHEETAGGAEKYLRDFLGGIERRRMNYALSAVKHLQLAGAPAATATWTGRAGPVDVVGVMYCVILKSRFIVSFHTQDLGSQPTSAMRDAMAAIEAAQLIVRP